MSSFFPGNNFFLPVSHLDESTFLESKYETTISDYWAYGQSLQKTLGVQQSFDRKMFDENVLYSIFKKKWHHKKDYLLKVRGKN